MEQNREERHASDAKLRDEARRALSEGAESSSPRSSIASSASRPRWRALVARPRPNAQCQYRVQSQYLGFLFGGEEQQEIRLGCARNGSVRMLTSRPPPLLRCN